MKKEKIIPADLVIVQVLFKARMAFEWIREIEKIWQEKYRNKQDASDERKQQGIILDALTTYLASLADKRSGTHSLIQSYKSNHLINEYLAHPIVKDCILHRNNRSAHQSINYRMFVSLEKVLNSDLDSLLTNIFTSLATFEKNPNGQNDNVY